jgi:ketosteroid isomerase-like protein
MSAADNKKLMETIFAAIAAGDRTLFVESLADDVTWRVTVQYSWSQTFKGKQALFRDLYGYLVAGVWPANDRASFHCRGRSRRCGGSWRHADQGRRPL